MTSFPKSLQIKHCVVPAWRALAKKLSSGISKDILTHYSRYVVEIPGPVAFMVDVIYSHFFLTIIFGVTHNR